MRVASVAMLALVLAAVAGVVRADGVEAEVAVTDAAAVHTDAAVAADAAVDADAEADAEGGPTGRRPGPEYIDPHPIHRDPLPVDKDVYALKLCCTQYHALDKNGIPYATCNQKYYWVCNRRDGKRCEYRPPRRTPKVPFSKKEKCPNFSPRTHSNFAGPCLRECSRILFSKELRSDRDLDDIDFGDS